MKRLLIGSNVRWVKYIAKLRINDGIGIDQLKCLWFLNHTLENHYQNKSASLNRMIPYILELLANTAMIQRTITKLSTASMLQYTKKIHYSRLHLTVEEGYLKHCGLRNPQSDPGIRCTTSYVNRQSDVSSTLYYSLMSFPIHNTWYIHLISDDTYSTIDKCYIDHNNTDNATASQVPILGL